MLIRDHEFAVHSGGRKGRQGQLSHAALVD